MHIINTIEFDTWAPAPSSEETKALTHALESGSIALLPRLRFELAEDERHLLSPRWGDGKAKNISYDPQSRDVRHTSAEGGDHAAIGRMMGRFAGAARTLVDTLFPAYAQNLRWGMTSYRPVEADGRASSKKKDDTLLHVDAFASRPTQGERILRVFCNINPDGKPREWEIGEPFEALTQRILPHIPKPLPGSAWLLKTLKITKGRRSAYDHYMLQLHDLGKADSEYQQTCHKTQVSLPTDATWVVYTDLVQHAVKSGQYLLEQTFYLPVDAMQEPALSPLSILEKKLGRKLA
jgi:hypothetical protein